MRVEKVTEINVYTTDGKLMESDATVVFESGGRCFAGVYKGIAKKGALMFESVISGANVKFNVMPNSIEWIYLADVAVLADVGQEKAESEE